VSMMPRAARGSATRLRVLIEGRVDVVPESREVDLGSAREGRRRHIRADEPASLQRHELANGGAVASDHEGLASVEGPHDLATSVS
jgi:hypothetical protein